MKETNTLPEIKEFLVPGKLVIAGASRNPKKFGGMVFGELKKRGFTMYPVHPLAQEIQGVRCYAGFEELPAGLDRLYIVTPAGQTAGVVEAAAGVGIRSIWIQQKSETPEALEAARKHGMKVIAGRCMMMFAEPVGGIHGFHRWLTRLVGSYPK